MMKDNRIKSYKGEYKTFISYHEKEGRKNRQIQDVTQIPPVMKDLKIKSKTVQFEISGGKSASRFIIFQKKCKIDRKLRSNYKSFIVSKHAKQSSAILYPKLTKFNMLKKQIHIKQKPKS